MASILYDSAYGGTCYCGTQEITLSSGLETPGAAGGRWDLIILPTGQIEVIYTYANGIQRVRYTSNIGCRLGQSPNNGQMEAGTLILQGNDFSNYAEAVNSSGLPPIPNACMVLTATGHLQIGCPTPTSLAEAQALIASGFQISWWDCGTFVALGRSPTSATARPSHAADVTSVQVTTNITVK